MNELLVVFLPCMLLMFLSESFSTYRIGELGEKVYIKKDKWIYVIVTIICAVKVGLRTWYNDTVTYIHGYELVTKAGSIFKDINWAIGANPGFEICNRILKNIGINTQEFLMIYALFTVCIYMWFIRKYSDNMWLSIFFFFTMGCYTFTFAAIKQCVAVAFCLLAIDKALKKKWTLFFTLLIIGSLFHPYALLFMIVPFLLFSPWTRKTYFWLFLFAVIGMTMQILLRTIISITTIMGENYSIEEFSGAGVNIFRLAVIWAPVLLSFMVRDNWKKNISTSDNLIMNLSMLNAELMFVALFGTANYFARLANYFLIFQTISLPMMFKFFDKKGRKILIIITIICYFVYFYYANVINQPFDPQHDSIRFIDFIIQI